MTSQLSSDQLTQLTPLLGSVARMVAKNYSLDENHFSILLLGVNVEPDPDVMDELKRWEILLTKLRHEPNKESEIATIEALTVRGLPEAPVLLAVSTVSNSTLGLIEQSTKDELIRLQVDVDLLDFGFLTPGSQAEREFIISGGPGRISVESDQIIVTPTNFGEATTHVRVEMRPSIEGVLWTSLKLITSEVTSELPVLAQIRLPESEYHQDQIINTGVIEDKQDFNNFIPRQGDLRNGIIAKISDTEILVNIGTESEGVIPSREIDQIDPELREELSIGNEVTVFVVNPEDQNGNVLLSFVRALEEKDWVFAESLLKSGETYVGKIVGFNKGGLIIPVGQLRGFVPDSQISLLRRLDTSDNTPEQRWGPMVDQLITVSVIEVDRERSRLILSERAALQETRESLKERLLEELSEDDIRTGRVTSLADFGAFVNIDGADGLVHLSEISWERIEHPREVLKVGQEVLVKVISVDRERKRIGLSIRQLQEDPWLKKIENLKEGQLVEGTITHLTKFGAFARLDEDLEGLIHISEISDQRVAHPKDVLHKGEVVTLRIIKIDPERHRIGLSLRKVDSPAYTDFDWKMTLAEVVEETSGEDEEAAPEEESRA